MQKVSTGAPKIWLNLRYFWVLSPFTFLPSPTDVETNNSNKPCACFVECDDFSQVVKQLTTATSVQSLHPLSAYLQLLSAKVCATLLKRAFMGWTSPSESLIVRAVRKQNWAKDDSSCNTVLQLAAAIARLPSRAPTEPVEC